MRSTFKVGHACLKIMPLYYSYNKESDEVELEIAWTKIHLHLVSTCENHTPHVTGSV